MLRTDGVLLGKYDIINKINKSLFEECGCTSWSAAEGPIVVRRDGCPGGTF